MLCAAHGPPAPSLMLAPRGRRRRAGLVACGSRGHLGSPRTSPPGHEGAEIFAERCARLPHARRRRHRGLGRRPNDRELQGRPELQPAQGALRARPLRDPQRRLLLGPDAAEHRGRQGGRGGRALRRRSTPGEEADTPPSPGQSGPPRSAARSGAGELACARMLDLKAIRRDPEPVRAALARRRDGSDERLDAALALDARRRELLPEVEALRARAERGLAGDRPRPSRRARTRRRRSPRCRRSRAGSRRSARS